VINGELDFFHNVTKLRVVVEIVARQVNKVRALHHLIRVGELGAAIGEQRLILATIVTMMMRLAIFGRVRGRIRFWICICSVVVNVLN